MTDRDHNRSNNSGTGGKALDRDDDLTTPSQSGTSGGELQREIGRRDEDKTALGGDPQPTSVHKGDKPDSGDMPNLPNRQGGQAAPEHSKPKRT